ncbi:hypothetical protein ABHC39_05745 [Pediococcus acidilactici]|uniref:hypothetical protein n=1 Tax=Pediococcus acidilactici TaxID=1254 RepID=UPI0001BEDDA0|nr:hypothetical protein [Pediococcus acidilactici]ARW24623.1 hypothetical protein S100424_01187 [Pediococcus acidilactici]ARW26665.1 hypothetical protein S100313_01230 [Pediococcus acidilactici]ARW28741.1 hypothetical protein S101189_01187 [Pediococcus acidilactici]EFA26038.1 hypothetical protein HMPREF9024_01538 [Pediococcus acidilactici 7_4]MDB8867562.1 hypothetical protein [Pediococcus acidilactici]
MALSTSQSISLSGTSTINGVQVATFSTVVSKGLSYTSVSMQITDQDLYEKNKAEVRKDRNDFQTAADNLSDSLDSGSVTSTE